MLSELNLLLSRIAPWIWMASSLFATGMLYRPWKLVRLYEYSNGRTPTISMTKFVCGILMGLSMGMSVVGMLSIYTWFHYPQLRAQRATDAPVDLTILSLISLVVLLSIPFVCAYIGKRKWNYLLEDEFDVPMPELEPSRSMKKSARKSSPTSSVKKPAPRKKAR